MSNQKENEKKLKGAMQSTESSLPSVTMMEANSDSIGGVADSLLNFFENENKLADRSEKRINDFFERVFEILLDWIATDESESIQQLLSKFNYYLCNDSKDYLEILDKLNPVQQIVIGLELVSKIMAVYLRTDNLAKYFGMLAGTRRSGWRTLLSIMSQDITPKTINDLYEFKVFKHNNTYRHALEQMAQMGLVNQLSKKGQTGRYALTWKGRKVGSMLNQLHNDEKRSDESKGGYEIKVPKQTIIPLPQKKTNKSKVGSHYQNYQKVAVHNGPYKSRISPFRHNASKRRRVAAKGRREMSF